MTRRSPITFLFPLALVSLGALTVAACGSGGGATAARRAPAHRATVRMAASSLGRILVDSQGRTLYLFKADSGSQSACTGACAVAWPPLLAGGNPSPAGGLNRSLISTIQRPGGAHQIAYNGHPLYRFVDDQQPGDVKGQGVTAFGAPWYAVTPAGSQVSGSASGSGALTGSPGTPGY